jgi:hypothetical protein
MFSIGSRLRGNDGFKVIGLKTVIPAKAGIYTERKTSAVHRSFQLIN